MSGCVPDVTQSGLLLCQCSELIDERPSAYLCHCHTQCSLCHDEVQTAEQVLSTVGGTLPSFLVAAYSPVQYINRERFLF
jgi:hypothetical protein